MPCAARQRADPIQAKARRLRCPMRLTQPAAQHMVIASGGARRGRTGKRSRKHAGQAQQARISLIEKAPPPLSKAKLARSGGRKHGHERARTGLSGAVTRASLPLPVRRMVAPPPRRAPHDPRWLRLGSERVGRAACSGAFHRQASHRYRARPLRYRDFGSLVSLGE